MPFGTLTADSRLGVANVGNRNASAFARAVLQLPRNCPVYQQQLIHNTDNAGGPANDAVWCGTPDDDISVASVIRAISAHDFGFGRRNLQRDQPPGPDAQYGLFDDHLLMYTNHLYYVGNEPEAFSCLQDQPGGGPCDCYEPAQWALDAYISACFPDPDSDFWEFWDGTGGPFRTGCAEESVDCRRIRAAALSRVFRHLKAEVGAVGGVVLPPAALNPELGDDPTDPRGSLYWQVFFDQIHNHDLPSLPGCPARSRLLPRDLEALHVHHFNPRDVDCDPPYDPDSYVCRLQWPLRETAYSITRVRIGADWHRRTYVGAGQPLPLDYLISEGGPDWQILAHLDPFIDGEPPSGVAW
ncbi:MAG: hypothetical protein ACRDIB_02280, partial [Ardenticatenaceae bacterium]